jgi:subtilase family serine protease
MRRITLAVLVFLTVTAFGGGSAQADRGGLPAHGDRAVCNAPARFDAAACAARVVTLPDGVTPLATTTYQAGYAPSDLQSAYGITSSSNATVAIVDAYDNPNAESDLAAYRTQFGLGACTSSNGCFTKVNQNGGSTMPSGNTGWGQEIDLDIEMVSAICPGCKILLVEANSNSLSDLGTAASYAEQHAVAVSNSYGTSGEFNGETAYDGYYNHPGVAVTASSGDSGYGVEFPAADSHVVAVGGTSLTGAPGSWSETAWNGAGSGCSSYFAAPSWQTSFFNTGCSARAEADISAVADPNTGVAVYDSYGSTGGANWYVFGGTSVASPIIASVFALANNYPGAYPASLLYGAAQGQTSSSWPFHDVTSGSNGRCTRGGWKRTGSAQLCTAGPGWDGPTGLGTPNGTSGF